MMSLVQDNFTAIGLQDYGVEINIDDLSKEEIKAFLDTENFNSLSYMKQDYFNFKKYINAQFAPRHMDYLNNDCAPDLNRFMSIKIEGKKTGCYYSFLQGIGEEDLPTFSDQQIMLLKYASSLLPLVRPHEFEILFALLENPEDYTSLFIKLLDRIPDLTEEQFQHALKYMQKKNAIYFSDDKFHIGSELDEQFKEHMIDLINYGLVKYQAEYSCNEDFLLWHSYSMDKVQLKLLKDPGYTMKGTYIYGKTVIIFASLKKDASIEERLAYKDKYITAKLFQWESENNVHQSDLEALINSDEALVFIRKVNDEHGIVQPFIYTGKGKLTNPRRQDKIDSTTGKPAITWLFDIMMENELPDYLQYDFILNNA